MPRQIFLPDMNENVYRFLVALGALVAVGCMSAEQRQQYAEAQARVQSSVQQLHAALDKSAGAKVRVMLAGSGDEQEFPLSEDEFAVVRDILSRTSAVPPALENEDDEDAAAEPYFAELVLLAENGDELSGVVLNDNPWMRESEARRLSPQRTRGRRVPDWCLPDADWERLSSLPTIPKARSWGARPHSAP